MLFCVPRGSQHPIIILQSKKINRIQLSIKRNDLLVLDWGFIFVIGCFSCCYQVLENVDAVVFEILLLSVVLVGVVVMIVVLAGGVVEI